MHAWSKNPKNSSTDKPWAVKNKTPWSKPETEQEAAPWKKEVTVHRQVYQNMPETHPAAANPFVEIKPAQRMVVLGFLGLYVAAILFAALSTHGVRNLPLWVGLVIRVCVPLIPFVFWKGRIGWLHPLVFIPLMEIAMLIARQTPGYIYGFDQHVALPHHTRDDLTTLKFFHDCLSALGFLAMMAGFSLFKNIRMPTLQIGKERYVLAKLAFAAALTCLSLWQWSQLAGGLEGMLLVRSVTKAQRDILAIGSHWQVLVFAFPYALLIFLALRPRAIRSLPFWVAVVFSMVSLYAMTGSRSIPSFYLLTTFLVNFYSTRRVPYIGLVLSVAVIVLGVGILGTFRTFHFGKTDVDFSVFRSASLEEAALAGTADLINRAVSRNGSLPILAKVPNEEGLMMGKTYLAFLFAPFPSSILPFDKPQHSGRLNGSIFFHSQAGVPCGTVSEAYWNFHVPGVVLIYLIFGAIAAAFAKFFVTNQHVASVAAFYLFFLLKADLNGTAWATWVQGSFLIAAISILIHGFPRITFQPKTT